MGENSVEQMKSSALEMLYLRYQNPGENIKQVVGLISLEFKKQVWAGDLNFRVAVETQKVFEGTRLNEIIENGNECGNERKLEKVRLSLNIKRSRKTGRQKGNYEGKPICNVVGKPEWGSLEANERKNVKERRISFIQSFR